MAELFIRPTANDLNDLRRIIDNLADPRIVYQRDRECISEGLANHCQAAPSYALREIAGVASWAGLSQWYIAKRLSLASGKKLTAGNVSNSFHSKSPRESTLRSLASAIGMTDLHVKLVSQPWPVVTLPASTSLLRPTFFRDSLLLDPMSSLTSAAKLYEIVAYCEEVPDRGIDLVNRVLLQRERIFATSVRGTGRSAVVVGFQVSREVLEMYNIYRTELRGAVDLEAPPQESIQESRNKALVNIFYALAPLSQSIYDFDVTKAKKPDEYCKAPQLSPRDILAVIDVAEQLIRARGFEADQMRERLNTSFDYCEWEGSEQIVYMLRENL